MKKQTNKPSKNLDWLLAIGFSYLLGFSFKASSIGWLKSFGIVLIIAGFLASLMFAAMLYFKHKDKVHELMGKLRKGDSKNNPTQLNKSPYHKWKEGEKQEDGQ